MLKKTLNTYHNRAIATQEVLEELIQLAKQIKEADQRGVDLGVNDDEVAFYDALSQNNSAREVMAKENLKIIATKLVTQVRKSATIDCTLQDEATKLVLQQAELLCAEWAEVA
jgi:type I restriction enzyme, R subunit